MARSIFLQPFHFQSAALHRIFPSRPFSGAFCLSILIFHRSRRPFRTFAREKYEPRDPCRCGRRIVCSAELYFLLFRSTEPSRRCYARSFDFQDVICDRFEREARAVIRGVNSAVVIILLAIEFPGERIRFRKRMLVFEELISGLEEEKLTLNGIRFVYCDFCCHDLRVWSVLHLKIFICSQFLVVCLVLYVEIRFT